MKKILEKIKNSWRDNRVLFVLMTILIICLILIAFVVADYFLGSTKDKYGDRLEGIDKVKITDKQVTDYEKKIAEDEKISKCEINKSGRTIYITITFTDVNLDDAKAKAQATLDLFEEKYKKYYDIHYTIIQKKKGDSAGFTMMGAHNANGSGLIWNNNNQPEEKKE